MVKGIARAKLHVLFVAAIISLSLPAVSYVLAVNQDETKIQAMQQIGKQLLDVGIEQYKRGMSDAAKATLNKAAVYKEYLSEADTAKLDELLAKLNVQAAPVQTEPQVTVNAAVVEEPNQPVESASGVVVSEPVNVEPVQPVEQNSPAVDVNADNTSVNNQYIEFLPVDSCDVQSAVPTEAPAAVTIEQADVNVQAEVNIQPSASDSNTQTQLYNYVIPQAAPINPSAPAEETAKESYIEVVKQKQRIQQSYTKAIVNESVAKAKECAEKEEFAQAKDEIARALGVVERNKLLLGDTDYTQYTATLNQLSDEVAAKQTEIEKQKAEQAKAEAQASQEKLRAQQTADREKRIQDLMAHAAEYQQQQKYQEALAQIETLLVIDPLNREALRSQQMLEDIINLRKQLEIKKEMGKEEEDLLTDNQRSMIPHADLMTYPRNWQDISAKREAASITGMSAEDVAIYKQLETVVNLGSLTPETRLEDAIDMIKNSTEPALKIVVRWKDLEENAYVERDTVIAMQGLDGIPIGKGLKELLNSVSGGITKIDYVVDDGIITVATKDSLPSKMVTHVYDITELIGTPANYSSQMTLNDDVAQTQDTETTSSDELEQDRADNSGAIMQMVQDTIAPPSWQVNGGEGTISIHGNRLVVTQTPQIHEQIQQLLMKDLRASLGHQVSIETRFLFVTENFLEDIGLNMNVGFAGPKSARISDIDFGQNSYRLAESGPTSVPGTLGGVAPALSLNGGNGIQLGGPNSDLAVTFLLRATVAHRDAKMLTAPRVTVLSGESATIAVSKQTSYVEDYDFQDITSSGDGQPIKVLADPQIETIPSGVWMDVTPTISSDNKYVLLQIRTKYVKVDITDYPVYSPTSGDSFPIQMPVSENADVKTRVSVPDGGTLLIGGQKLGAEINKEAGVPGLSKAPIIGRLFSNRSKVKDQDILLILVKPTIILQEEAEREYFAPLE